MKNHSRVRRYSRRNISSRILDQLESRMMLSGNMTASLSNGILTLQGNNLNNSVIIDQASLTTTQFRISSGDGTTTLNGKATALVFSGVTGIVINVASGNDTVLLQNAFITNNLQISGASGNQAITLNQVTIGGNFSLTNNGGQNNTTVENTTIDGSATVNAGAGFNSQCGSCWGGSNFSQANQIFTLATSTINNSLSISNASGETTTDIESSTLGNNLTVTNGAGSYGNCGFNCCGSSASLAGDLFTLDASTIANNVSVSNASDGNTTLIEGGTSIGGNLAVSNVVGTSSQSCFNSCFSCNLANASDSFTMTDASSVAGNLALANISDGASTVIENFAFIGGGLTVNNGVGSYGQGFTSCGGQNSDNFGDFLTLSSGAFVNNGVTLTNGSTYNSTDVDSAFIGGNLTISNGLNLSGSTSNSSCCNNFCGSNSASSNSVYTTDIFTLNATFIGGSVAVTNARGYTNTLIEGGSFITDNATFTNASGTADFVMNNTQVGNNLTFTAGAGTTTVTVTQSSIGNDATITATRGASITIDPTQVGEQLQITL